MKRALNMCVAAVGLVLMVAAQSQAQDPAPIPAPAPDHGRSWKDRGFIMLDFASQMGTADTITSSRSLALYDETGDVATTQSMSGDGSFFGHGGGVRVFKNFGLGFAYSRVKTAGTWSGTAHVPHPVIYDSPRTVTKEFKDLDREERAYHLQIVFVLPLGKKFDIMASAGPTYFKLEQDVVGDPDVAEVGPPYTSVQLSDISLVTSKIQKWGYNVGADLTYRVWENFGLGGFVRWSGTTVNVDSGIRAAFDTKVGGFQAGGGLRIRF